MHYPYPLQSLLIEDKRPVTNDALTFVEQIQNLSLRLTIEEFPSVIDIDLAFSFHLIVIG
jgi:hypothetical protein